MLSVKLLSSLVGLQTSDGAGSWKVLPQKGNLICISEIRKESPWPPEIRLSGIKAKEAVRKSGLQAQEHSPSDISHELPRDWKGIFSAVLLVEQKIKKQPKYPNIGSG